MTARASTLATAALVSLLAACSKPPAIPEVEAAVKLFDAKIASTDASLNKLAPAQPGAETDFRGRTIRDDLDQWASSSETRRKLEDLRARALEARYLGDARQLLQSGEKLLEERATRGKEISQYWNSHLPAPYWRRYWRQLFVANGLTEEPPDSMLVAVEQRLTRSLDAGDFIRSAQTADELNDLLSESLNLAANRINSASKMAQVFVPRKSACPAEAIAPTGDRPRVVGGESIESFYPRDAINRGEQGTVVLVAQIDVSGCAKEVAIKVRSGVESLDAAALQWFESARFSPAADRGRPVPGRLAWKIRFVLKK